MGEETAAERLRREVGGRVLALRKGRGWAQDELVRVSGLSKGTVQNLEAGKYEPRASTLRALAEVFGVTTDYLLGLEPAAAEEPTTPVEEPAAEYVDAMSPPPARRARRAGSRRRGAGD